jgi:hypothetical protein
MAVARVALLLFVLSGTAFADSFEFLAFAPPGKPWVKESQGDGRIIYTRKAAQGIGIIVLIPSVTPIGTPVEEFETFWRANVTRLDNVGAPIPQSKPARDLTMVWGAAQVEIAGAKTDIQVVMFVGRGSVLGTVTMTSTADAVRDVAAFNASVKILDENRPKADQPAPAAPTPTAPTRAAEPVPKAGELAVTFTAPPGYTVKNENGGVWMIPEKLTRATGCAYGIAPPRASTGSLEKDADAALKQLPAGWEAVGESEKHHGVGPSGWPYWFKSVNTRMTGKPAVSSMMVLALPAPNQQTTILWGFGTTMDCIPDDTSFAQVFHSLEPKGWTSDGGKALRTGLQAGWRFTTSSSTYGMMQYAFYPNGRYQFAMGTSSVIGYYEYTYAGVGDGAWKLEGDVLTITRDKDKRVQKYRVRYYTTYIAASWREAIALYDDTTSPPSALVYYKILDEKPR